MRNFKLRVITAKAGMICICCFKKHEQGETVPMEFVRFGGRRFDAVIVCDGDCLADLAECNQSADDKFLSKLSVQFN